MFVFLPKVELKAFGSVIFSQSYFLVLLAWPMNDVTDSPLKPYLIAAVVGIVLVFLGIARSLAKIGAKAWPIYSFYDGWLLGWTAGGCVLIGLTNHPFIWLIMTLGAISAPHVRERIRYVSNASTEKL